MGCLFADKGPQRDCSIDYPTDYRYWCGSCLRMQIQATEHMAAITEAELHRTIRQLRRQIRRSRIVAARAKGGA